MNVNRYTPEELWLLKEKHNGTPSPSFEEDRKRLQSGEPLAYVIGSIPFLNTSLSLGSHPLIPRPETEWWIQHLIHMRTHPPKRILDICAGSGAIGVALAKAFPESDVYSADIVTEHIDTIKENFKRNDVQGTVIQSDLFEKIPGTFDLIVTNPPYISDERMEALPSSVSEFEPHEALAGGPDGLSLIRTLVTELPKHLTRDGEVWMEIDDQQGTAVTTLFNEIGFTTHILNDQYNLPRVAVAQWKHHDHEYPDRS
jgi:release factor glutamine methyltransferase